MGRKKDALTGLYMSDEQAASQDPATWIEESDKKSLKKSLNEVYAKCSELSYKPDGWTTNIVHLNDLKTILNELGASID